MSFNTIMKNNKNLNLINNKSGFSLLEILIGLTLLALIGGVVATNVFDRLYEGQVKTAKIQMQAFSGALKDYRRHCGAYPTTEQTLNALVEKPTTGRECKRYQPGGYLEEVALDPWDNEYYYESDGRTFNIISLGNDGDEGGEGEAADISLKEKKGDA